jgi:hypothetical protein
MLAIWLLSLESGALTAYTIAGEIKLARLERVPPPYAIHLVFMWALTLFSWALVVVAWHPYSF